jgi:lysophospholipase L1-like esterase
VTQPTPDGAGRTWRISVLGNSLPILMFPPRASRREATYPEHLERTLRDRGVDVEVRNDSRLFGLITEGYRRFQTDEVPWGPDVLVVHFGIIELQANVVPTVISRHLTAQHPGGKGVVGLYRRRVMPKLWPKVRAYQRWACGHLGERTWRLPPAAFEAELRRLIRVARRDKVLVLVCDINPPGPRLQHFMPGIEGRYDRYQTIIRRVVADADDPDVRLVRASAIAAAQTEGAGTDGLHFTANGHAEMAAVLADQVEPWLRCQARTS